MVPASRIDRSDGDAGGDQEDAHDRQPLGVDDVVDVAALGGQQQRAVDRAVALDGHGDRDDQLAAVVDAHDLRRRAVERGGDFLDSRGRWRRRAPCRSAGRGCESHSVEVAPDASRATIRSSSSGGGRSKRRIWPREIEVAGIDDQRAVAVVDAGARARRRDQPAQDRRDLLRIDGEVEVLVRLVERREALPGLQVEQLVRDRW